MADLRPFRGLRYHVPAQEAGTVIAPPYDVISEAQQAALYDLSPHNIIRIEYGRDAGDARYAAAAETLHTWRQRGLLAPEPAPALYLYEQIFAHGGRSYRRRGVIGRVRLEPLEAGIIRPHEYTMAPAKADRLALLRATRTNVSPILALLDDAGGLLSAALARVPEAPAMEAVDFTGQRHRLTVIAQPDLVRALTDAVAGRPLYIADGHHRYETALTYQAERRAAAGAWSGAEPENFVLMSITATSDPGLLILPIHRLVQPARAPAGAPAALGESFQVEEIGELSDGGARARAVHALARHGEHTNAFVAVGLVPGRLHLLTLRGRAAVERRMPGEHPPSWKALDVNVLQYGVLEPLFGIDAEALAAGARVQFTEDAEEAFEAVGQGRTPLAFLLNPTRPEQIIAVADAGDRMPQKSTYFYPKLGTGLVLNSHDD